MTIDTPSYIYDVIKVAIGLCDMAISSLGFHYRLAHA